jgi:diacylglycerol kinase-like protein
MVLDCARGLDRLDRGGFKHGVRILARRGVPEFSSRCADAKDVAAGAVLITALASSVIGAIIFWPHVMGLLGR